MTVQSIERPGFWSLRPTHQGELLAPVYPRISRTFWPSPTHISHFFQNSWEYHAQPGLAPTISAKATHKKQCRSSLSPLPSTPVLFLHSFLCFSWPPPESSDISKLVYKLILSKVSSSSEILLCSRKISSRSPLAFSAFSKIVFRHLFLSLNPLEHFCSFSPGWFLKVYYAYSDILSSCSEKCCRIRHKVTQYPICQNHGQNCSHRRSWNSLDNLILSVAFISCRLLS